MKGKLRKALNKFSIFALLLIISCNANMNANDKHKALNESKLLNISEVIKNSLQIESDLKKESKTNTSQNTPPILEIEKIEPGKQGFLLKSESGNESLLPPEAQEEVNVVKSEEEIEKIQEKLLLIGASDEIMGQELGPNMQKSLYLTTVEFKISNADSTDSVQQVILNPIEETVITNVININDDNNIRNKDKIFDQKKEDEESSTLLNEYTKNSTQNQLQKHTALFDQDASLITKEYTKQAEKSLEKALNAIRSLEKSKLLKIKNLETNQENPAESSESTESNNTNDTKDAEKTKNKLLEELKKSELIFENTKDPLGTNTIKQVMDAAKKWQEKENSGQINWDLGSKFHPNPKLYNKSVAQKYKVLAEKFKKVQNEYEKTKEQLKVQSKLTTKNISKIVDATKEFADQVRNLILLLEENNNK
ncbi:hypothetical protein QIA41_04780 (plasmid) [Borreliella sinica]|uniref:hypothetical protein n=1 Tax=Borreliella sinica TaxID=87162 RepID=UPI002A23E8B0|nr:hypothetical protein [Borreliella sinica]WPM06411.1 hypothetical protein QIA41_04780 [Borreliella sinica]